MLVEVLTDFKAPQPILNNASIIQESNRRPDVFYYIARGGSLYAPDGSLIREQIRVKTLVDKLEARAFEEIERISGGEEKTIIWISPLQFGVYDVSKITISEVINQGEYNVLFNRSVILDDLDSDKSLKLAQELAKSAVSSPILRTVDDVRANIVVLNPRQKYWLTLLEELAPDPQWQMIRSGQDIELQRQALITARQVYESRFKRGRERVKMESYTGGRSLSCPIRGSSPYEAFSGASRAAEVCSEIKCPNCGWKPDSYQEQLLERGELTSCPDCGYIP